MAVLIGPERGPQSLFQKFGYSYMFHRQPCILHKFWEDKFVWPLLRTYDDSIFQIKALV